MTETDLARRVELERKDAARAALEAAAEAVEKRSGSEVYQRAWRAAARVIRALKP